MKIDPILSRLPESRLGSSEDGLNTSLAVWGSKPAALVETASPK